MKKLQKSENVLRYCTMSVNVHKAFSAANEQPPRLIKGSYQYLPIRNVRRYTARIPVL